MLLVEPSRLRESWWAPLGARVGVPAELDGFPLGVGYVRWAQPARSEVISLPYDEVNLVLTGRLRVEVRGASVTAEAGQAILLEQGCYTFSASEGTIVCSVIHPPGRMPSAVEEPVDWKEPRAVDPLALTYRNRDGHWEDTMVYSGVEVPNGFSILPTFVRVGAKDSTADGNRSATLTGPHVFLTVMSGSFNLGDSDLRASFGQSVVVDGAGPLSVTGTPGALACVHRARPSPAQAQSQCLG